jgi:hypothetical protein
MLLFQAASIDCSEFDAPQTDGFTADGDPSFSQQVFDVAVTQIEAIVEPDGVGNDVRWESVTFICIHWPILPISAS